MRTEGLITGFPSKEFLGFMSTSFGRHMSPWNNWFTACTVLKHVFERTAKQHFAAVSAALA